MADVAAAASYSNTLANVAKEMTVNLSPLQQAAQQIDMSLKPAREQMRLNSTLSESVREKMFINQEFFDRIAPRFDMSSLAIPQFESALKAMNISAIQEMQESLAFYNESILNEMMTRQLYVNVATAEVSDDLSEDQESVWYEIRDKLFEYSPTVIYYALGIGLATYTTIQIITDPTGLEFITTVAGHYHNEETARRNKDRDT